MSQKKLLFISTTAALIFAISLISLHYYFNHQLLQQQLRLKSHGLQQAYQQHQAQLQTDLHKLARLLSKNPDFMTYLASHHAVESLYHNWDTLQPYFDYPTEFIDFAAIISQAENNPPPTGLQINAQHSGIYTQLSVAQPQMPQLLILGSPFQPLLRRLDSLYSSGFALLVNQHAVQSTTQTALLVTQSDYKIYASSRSDIPQLPLQLAHIDNRLIKHNTSHYVLHKTRLSTEDNNPLWLLTWQDVSPLMQQFWQQQGLFALLVLIGLVVLQRFLFVLIFQQPRLWQHKTQAQHKQISHLQHKIKDLLSFDEQTHLYNKRYFDHYIEQEISRCLRTGASFSVIMLGIDDYATLVANNEDNINQSVKQLATVVKTALRDIDLSCYYGDGIFGAALIETDIKGAKIVTERLHQMIVKNIFPDDPSQPSNLTVSIGVTQWQEDTYEISLLALVMQALHNAQKNGGNQICVI